MYLAIDVGFGMVHDFMHVSKMQLVIGHGVIGVDRGSVFHVVENFVLQSLSFDVRHDLERGSCVRRGPAFP